MRLWLALPLLALLTACGGGGAATSVPPASSAPLPSLQVDTASNQGLIAPQLLGVNLSWEDLGQGIVTGGELVQDRSFRSFGVAGSPWLGLPGNGAVAVQASGGDPMPAAGGGYAGYVQLTGGPSATDIVGVAQTLLGSLKAGTSYTLCCSTYAEGPQAPTLSLALAQLTPYVVTAAASDTTTVGAWKRHRFTLTPTQDVDGALVSLAIQGPGSVRLDEVRLSALPDGLATIDPNVKARLVTLGARVLRWPGGTLVDTFDWKASIGSTLHRGESLANGRYQTPTLGLDEFLRLCEELGAEPLIQVNLFGSSTDAADLVEYCNGDSNRPYGSLRAANGHRLPYQVTHFELGNEPTSFYISGSNYAGRAASFAEAMKNSDASIRLSGIVETSFELADWRSSVPLLANWNQGALSSPSSNVSFLHGHYYSYFDTDADPATRFRRLMAAGTVLRRTRDGLATQSPLPLWITEYHVDLQQSGQIQSAYLVDAASGLSVADELMALLQGDFGGACAWNLNESSGFGFLVHPGVWDFRPAGLAFQLLSPFAGETRLSTTLSDIATISLGAGKGNIPSNTSYSALSVLASRQSNGHVRLALLNRTYDQSVTLKLPIAGTSRLTWLTPTDLTATNEGAIQVQLTIENRTFAAGDTLLLPAHSLVRIDY